MTKDEIAFISDAFSNEKSLIFKPPSKVMMFILASLGAVYTMVGYEFVEKNITTRFSDVLTNEALTSVFTASVIVLSLFLTFQIFDFLILKSAKLLHKFNQVQKFFASILAVAIFLAAISYFIPATRTLVPILSIALAIALTAQGNPFSSKSK